MIVQVTKLFSAGFHLDSDAAEVLLDAMITSGDEGLLTGLFLAWQQKGITSDEIYMFANVFRRRSIKVHSLHETCVDIVGTGGSSSKTFNVSTAAAFAVAGTGLAVAKHGNRAATSSSGSADVLSELGVRPDVSPERAELCLNELGICFMYAPNHHRLSPMLARVRRRLGFPTIFNCIGPLCNPADVPHQIIGVWSRKLVVKLAKALADLGTARSWVVHGHDQLDEISTTGRTTVSDVSGRSMTMFEVTARDVGIYGFAGDLPFGCSAVESAEIIRRILANKMRESDAEKLVLLNAAAALHVAGKELDLKSAYSSARDSIRSGAAADKLKGLAQMTMK